MPPIYIPNEGEPIDFNNLNFDAPDDDGLMGVGANFHPQTLVNAYMSGLFPWFIHDGLPFWYCPDPRMVLYPEKLKISQSMKQVIKRDTYQYTSDTAFDQVIHHCARAKRKGTDQTWIDENFIHSYSLMHEIGLAHSFEAWWNGKLVGGLYGLAIGEVFFGESMFSNESNASKAAFIQGVQFLRSHQFKMIDCQTPTEHLKSLGAESISREKFLHDLEFDVLPPALNQKNWSFIFQIFLAR